MSLKPFRNNKRIPRIFLFGQLLKKKLFLKNSHAASMQRKCHNLSSDISSDSDKNTLQRRVSGSWLHRNTRPCREKHECVDGLEAWKYLWWKAGCPMLHKAHSELANPHTPSADFTGYICVSDAATPCTIFLFLMGSF